jgi:hypothetical protein
MRTLALLGLLAIACQHGAPPPTPAADERSSGDAAFVLPGDFSEQTTIADLEVRFGAANVAVTKLPDEDDRVVVLFPNDPTRRATVRFWDDLAHLSSVTVTDAGSRWRGKQGVAIGTSFAALREKNVERFFFSGFNEAGEGAVRDMWNAGALDVTEGEQLYFGVDLRVRRVGTALPAAALPRDEMQLASDEPLYPMLGEIVEVSALVAWSSLDDEWGDRRRPSDVLLAGRSPR